MSRSRPAAASSSTPTSSVDARPRAARAVAERPKRLVSLDAYRGFVMIMLASAGFGIAKLAGLPRDAPVWNVFDFDVWQQLAVHFEHSKWVSTLGVFGVPFWDMIQPAFMFMVGVAMPYSYARRAADGQGPVRRFAHAAWRAIILVLLGVFLSSNWSPRTNWTFANVLCQIGLGYLFVYLLLGRRFWIQLVALAVVLVGYWGLFFAFPPPANFDYAKAGAEPDTVMTGRFAPWSKNSNVAARADKWLLNQFPTVDGKRFDHNKGGYATLNFVPSIGTMLLGVFCGTLLRSKFRWWEKLLTLVLAGVVCMELGVLAGQYACPIVKRIWTPSWVLYSGAWAIWALAVFYLVFDLCRLRWLAIPLTIVGMNSLAMYMMGQLLRPWAMKTVHIHFAELIQYALGPNAWADNMYGYLIGPISALVVFWLIALWMYRHKFFIRV